MSTPRSPFTRNKQEELKKLLQQQLPSLDISYDEFVDWLASYIKDEDFYRTDTIRQDLLDPTYSDIKSNIQSEFKWDDKILQIIINILLNDIFPGYFGDGNRNSIVIDTEEEEETKVFYPLEIHRRSENELASAFAEAIGGLDQMSPSPKLNNTTNNTNKSEPIEDDMRSNSHIHDDIIEMNDERKDEELLSRENSTSPHIDLLTVRGALKDLDHLRGTTIRRQQSISRWDGEEIDPIEDDSNDDEFPWHLNVALFHRSDDESLELLIDKAVLEIYKGDKFKKLWKTQWFIKSIYNDKLFPKAVDKVFDLIDEVNINGTSKNNINNKKKLGFIGNFVDYHFQRQIKEYKRKIEVQSDEHDQELLLRATESVIEDDDKRQTWLVYYIDNKYVIEKQKLPHKQKLMILRIREDDRYSWAVWKKKTSVKKDNIIRSKGYWDVLERYDEEEHKEKRWKDLQQFAGEKQQTSTPRLPFGKLAAMPTLKVIKTNSASPATNDSLNRSVSNTNINININTNTNTNINSNTGKSGKKKSKFLYIPLDHLKLIFELMQFHYHWSIQSEVEKKDFEKNHENIITTPLYSRYCGKQKYEAICKECDKITIDGIRYTLIWWNYVGQKKCNAFCIQIGDDDREYYYLRFKNTYKKFRWFSCCLFIYTPFF